MYCSYVFSQENKNSSKCQRNIFLAYGRKTFQFLISSTIATFCNFLLYCKCTATVPLTLKGAKIDRMRTYIAKSSNITHTFVIIQLHFSSSLRALSSTPSTYGWFSKYNCHQNLLQCSGCIVNLNLTRAAEKRKRECKKNTECWCHPSKSYSYWLKIHSINGSFCKVFPFFLSLIPTHHSFGLFFPYSTLLLSDIIAFFLSLKYNLLLIFVYSVAPFPWYNSLSHWRCWFTFLITRYLNMFYVRKLFAFLPNLFFLSVTRAAFDLLSSLSSLSFWLLFRITKMVLPFVWSIDFDFFLVSYVYYIKGEVQVFASIQSCFVLYSHRVVYGETPTKFNMSFVHLWVQRYSAGSKVCQKKG